MSDLPSAYVHPDQSLPNIYSVRSALLLWMDLADKEAKNARVLMVTGSEKPLYDAYQVALTLTLTHTLTLT